MTPAPVAAASDAFAAIRDSDCPVVLRGLVADWPAVVAGRAGPRAMADHILAFDRGVPTTVFSAPPEVKGRFFYRDDMRGFNFGSQSVTLGRLLASLVDLADDPAPPALYAGATPTGTTLAGFAEANPLPVDLPGATPRIWIGNASRIAVHYDMSPNLACVVAGRRRFTLFPPDQIANLYVGPVEHTPAGQPTSMVDPAAPDRARHPRYAAAEAAALVADLEPGDALWMPPLWWHGVEATGPLNVLVNHWTDRPGAPFGALMNAVLAIRERPDSERAAWRAWFDHYVFGADAADAVAHLPAHARGVLGPPDPQRDDTIRRYVASLLAGG